MRTYILNKEQIHLSIVHQRPQGKTPSITYAYSSTFTSYTNPEADPIFPHNSCSYCIHQVHLVGKTVAPIVFLETLSYVQITDSYGYLHMA